MVKPDAAPSSSDTATSTFRDTNQSLQERLHTLLTRLSDTSKILETWPETKTDEMDESSSIQQHAKTTTQLMQSINRVVDGVKLVEEIVNGESEIKGEDGSTKERKPTALSNQLRQTPVPIDLLDMMDYASGLNPDCFARGLIKESLRQLGNLQRRKASMKLLAAVIQNGMAEKEKQLEILKSLDEKLLSSSSANKDISSEKKEDSDGIDSNVGSDVEGNNKNHKRKREYEEEENEQEPPHKK